MSDEAPPLVLDSTDAFFEALRAPDLGTALAVLQAVSESPESALAFGKKDGLDVVDELIRQSYQREGVTFLEVVLATLAAFDDPRAVDRMVKLLHGSQAAGLIRIAVGRLAREPLGSYESEVRPLLMQERSREHARAAADLLLASRNLSPAERLRATVANTEERDTGPDLDWTTADLWIREIAGWYGIQTRRVLESRAGNVFEVLASKWAELDADSKSWLLRLGVARDPLETAPVLRRALEDADPSVVMTALSLIRDMEGGPLLFAGAMSPLVHHPEPNVRILALQAGAKHDDWRGLLARESHPEAKGWVARRLAQAEGSSGVDALEPLLADPDWRVRAGATAAFVSLGPAAIPVLRKHAQSGRQDEKVAAMQGLVELGDYAWMEENVVGDGL